MTEEAGNTDRLFRKIPVSAQETIAWPIPSATTVFDLTLSKVADTPECAENALHWLLLMISLYRMVAGLSIEFL